MAAFEGGPLSTIGITPSFITNLSTQTASSGAPALLGQVWKGSGQSFIGSAGQGLAGSLAGSAINVALNTAFGTNVAGPQGLRLNTGQNLLASVVTPQITGSLAGGINQQIQQTLSNAGPFGPILSNVATGLVSQGLNGVASSLLGNALASGAGATNYKMFPGGGDGEAPADYGGSSYTLSEVTFSIQPANQGPQAFGDVAFDASKLDTSLPWGDVLSADLNVDFTSVNNLKRSVMQGNFLGDVTSTSTGIA